MGWFTSLANGIKSLGTGDFSGLTSKVPGLNMDYSDPISSITGQNAGNAVFDALGISNGKATDAATGTLDSVGSNVTDTSNANKQLYGDYLTQAQQTYGDANQSYNDAVNNYGTATNSAMQSATDNANAYKAALENAQGKSYDIGDYYDAAAEQRASAATDAITNSAANAGGMFSSDYLNKLAAKQQALASEEYSNAYDRMMKDRSQTESENNDYLNGLKSYADMDNSANSAYQQNLKTLMDTYGSDRDAYQQAVADYYTNMAAQNNADLSAVTDLATAKAGLESDRTSGVGAVLGTGGNLIGSIFKGLAS